MKFESGVPGGAGKKVGNVLFIFSTPKLGNGFWHKLM